MITDARDRRLLDDVDVFLAAALRHLEGASPGNGDHRGSVTESREALRRVEGVVLERLDDADADVAVLTDLALRATELERDVRRRILDTRLRRLAGVEEALGRLRRRRTSAELLDEVCPELVRGCGFQRVLLSRVQGGVWRPWMVHFSGDAAGGQAFMEWIREREVQLAQLPLERAVVTSREPEIVRDAADDPRTYQPFVEAGRIRSYVVAPVIPAGRVVGLLHADRGPDDRVVDIDRDVLWAFAEAFGRLYERMVVLERARAQRSHIRETFQMAETMMVALANADIEIEGSDPDDDAAIQHAIQEPTPLSAVVDELLTAREKDVLTMLVRGYSNAVIATRLGLKVGTVKGHVQRILRKLGAANRAEAISRYLGAGVGDDKRLA